MHQLGEYPRSICTVAPLCMYHQSMYIYVVTLSVAQTGNSTATHSGPSPLTTLYQILNHMQHNNSDTGTCRHIKKVSGEI